MMTLGSHIETTEINVDYLRHFVLNSLRRYKQKFGQTYGEMVICCDDGDNWRKEINPYYKAHRVKDRQDSALNWNDIFTALHTIRAELKETFPYRVIHVQRAEADDVIASFCHEFGNSMEKIVIISADKDFRQLQSYMNVQQYDPIRDRYIEDLNPDRFRKELIIKGDGGDGVCNIRSPANSMVLKIRQKPITQKNLDAWLNQEPEEFCDEAMLARYEQNKKVVDLFEIPQWVTDKTMEEYKNQAGKGRDKLWNYFIEHRLKNLLESIGEF